MHKRTATTPAPPRTLSAESAALWRSTLTEYAFDTGVDLTLLRMLCESLDGVRACQRRVKKDGLLAVGAGGQIRPHPLLATEAEYRKSILAAVRALRLSSVPEF